MTQILGRKPFAVRLINFTDSPDPQPFTHAAALEAWGTIARYWEYDSYGKVTLGGSEVFDWQTYPSTRAAFTAKHSDASGAHRAGMIDDIKTTFGFDETKFQHLVIIFSEAVGDAWTSGNGSIFEPTIIATGTICHEMTHQFGEPDHSWDYSSRTAGGGFGEYWDQTDVMSAQNCWYANQTATDPFSGSGPHHCMFWRDKFGWLDDDALISRISDHDAYGGYNHTFTLYARNEPVVARLNCIQILDLWIELDVNTNTGDETFHDDFDTGLTGSGVVIHQRGTVASGNTVPYVVVPDLKNNPDQKFWSAGQVYAEYLDRGGEPGINVYVWVRSIDLADGSAHVNVSTTYPAPLTRHAIVAVRKGHSTAGGGAGFDYISQVGIRDDAGNLVGLPRSWVVRWISNGRNSFYVAGADGSQAEVVVVEHWLQTHPDSNPADNLLSLPDF